MSRRPEITARASTSLEAKVPYRGPYLYFTTSVYDGLIVKASDMTEAEFCKHLRTIGEGLIAAARGHWA